MELIDGRRFYMQNYKCTMLGFLIDSDEFEVKPAISRAFIVNESMKGGGSLTKKYISKTIDITLATLISNGTSTIYSVGENITVLFNVSINGIVQEKDVHYSHSHFGGLSNINFSGTPLQGDVIVVSYYKGRNNKMYDQNGNELQVGRESFDFNGVNLVFDLQEKISSVISVTTNGLIEFSEEGYEITGQKQITLTSAPVFGATLDFVYLY